MIPKAVTVDFRRRTEKGWMAGYDAGGRLCELVQTGPGGSFYRLQDGTWAILVQYEQSYVETVASKVGAELRSSFRTGDDSVGLDMPPSPIAPVVEPPGLKPLPPKKGL